MLKFFGDPGVQEMSTGYFITTDQKLFDILLFVVFTTTQIIGQKKSED